MTQTAPGIKPAFNYSLLKQQGPTLQQTAAVIHAHVARIHDDMIVIGDHLIKAKRLLSHGLWLRWLELEFDWSEDSATNYMNVAKRMREIPKPAQPQMNASGMYLLARRTTPDSARDTALELAANGTKIDYQAAFILARAPMPIQERFKAGLLPKDQAYQLTQRWKQIDRPVQAYALEQQVSHYAVLEYLNRAYRERDTRTAWADILHNQGRLMIRESPVTLKEATGRDVARYEEWRAYCRLEAERAAALEAAPMETLTYRGTAHFQPGGQVLDLRGQIPRDITEVEYEIRYQVPKAKAP